MERHQHLEQARDQRHDRKDHRPDRAQRRRQDDLLQHADRRLQGDGRPDRVRRLERVPQRPHVVLEPEQPEGRGKDEPGRWERLSGERLQGRRLHRGRVESCPHLGPRTLEQGEVGEIVVVASAYDLETEERVVRCPDWERGPGASLRCGLAALGSDVEHADPAFAHPAKPVGPVHAALATATGDAMKAAGYPMLSASLPGSMDPFRFSS